MATNVMGVPSAPLPQEDRTSSCNWKRGVLMINVAVAIAGVALSVFTGISLGVTGSILWAVSAVATLYLASETLDEEKLRLLTNQLQQSDAKIQLEQQRALELKSALEGERDALQQTELHLQNQLASFSEDNRKLKERNAALDRAIKDLELSNNALKQNSDALQGKVALLSKVMGDVSGQVSSLVEEHVELGKKVEIFESEAGQLSALGRDLNKSVAIFDDRFDEDCANLSKHLQLLKTTSSSILGAALKQKEQLQDQVSSLSAVCSDVAEKTKKLDEKMRLMAEEEKQFVNISRQLAKTKEELASLEKQIADKQGLLDQRTEVLTDLNGKIIEQNECLLQVIAKVEEEFKLIREKKIQELSALSEQISIKQKLIIEIDKELHKKISIAL